MEYQRDALTRLSIPERRALTMFLYCILHKQLEMVDIEDMGHHPAAGFILYNEKITLINTHTY